MHHIARGECGRRESPSLGIPTQLVHIYTSYSKALRSNLFVKRLLTLLHDVRGWVVVPFCRIINPIVPSRDSFSPCGFVEVNVTLYHFVQLAYELFQRGRHKFPPIFNEPPTRNGLSHPKPSFCSRQLSRRSHVLAVLIRGRVKRGRSLTRGLDHAFRRLKSGFAHYSSRSEAPDGHVQGERVKFARAVHVSGCQIRAQQRREEEISERFLKAFDLEVELRGIDMDC